MANLKDTTVNGTVTTTSHGTSANWNTAYGWGNHASAGYASTSAVNAKGDPISVFVDGQDDGVVVSIEVSTGEGTMTFTTSTSNTYVATLFK